MKGQDVPYLYDQKTILQDYKVIVNEKMDSNSNNDKSNEKIKNPLDSNNGRRDYSDFE